MKEKQRYVAYRDMLRQAFPVWTKVRKDPNAIGSQLLHVIGMRLADMEWFLEYAYQQCYLATADVEQMDTVYRGRIPNELTSSLSVQFISGGNVLRPVTSIETFLREPVQHHHYPALTSSTQCYIDYDKKYIYTKQPVGDSLEFPEGMITLVILGDHEMELYRQTIPLHVHHVWNVFDEFGLLLDTPRLHGEKNAEYKQRLLDVFRRPASSTYEGLMNGIGRELGLTYEVKWNDTSKDYTLPHNRVHQNSITVNGQPYPSESITVNEHGYVILKAYSYQLDEPPTVRYVAGVELHELHDTDDKDFQNELYRIDGTATPRLQYYVETIQNRVPIMWGQWKWNQGFWNVADDSMSGYGSIPTLYDARFMNWKRYQPKEE